MAIIINKIMFMQLLFRGGNPLKLHYTRTFTTVAQTKTSGDNKQAHVKKLAHSVKKKPIMLVSEYGELLNVKPMIKTKTETIYREVQMIGDNSDAKTLMKKLHQSPNCYFLFDPKGHFTNAQTLYMAMKK